ncbi:hypothetical protein D3C72_2210880 [compost metagenome]
MPFDGQLQHRQAGVARRVQRGPLPGIGGRDELDLSKAQRLQGVFCQRDVRDVDGVETAAQESDSFQTQSRGFR